jgi:hypothetical protein
MEKKGFASLLDAFLLNASLENNFFKVKIPAINLNDRLAYMDFEKTVDPPRMMLLWFFRFPKARR